MTDKQSPEGFWKQGYRIRNDRGHYLIYDGGNCFMGSCDTEELNHMLDELEVESEG